MLAPQHRMITPLLTLIPDDHPILTLIPDDHLILTLIPVGPRIGMPSLMVGLPAAVAQAVRAVRAGRCNVHARHCPCPSTCRCTHAHGPGHTAHTWPPPVGAPSTGAGTRQSSWPGPTHTWRHSRPAGTSCGRRRRRPPCLCGTRDGLFRHSQAWCGGQGNMYMRGAGHRHGTRCRA